MYSSVIVNVHVCLPTIHTHCQSVTVVTRLDIYKGSCPQPFPSQYPSLSSITVNLSRWIIQPPGRTLASNTPTLRQTRLKRRPHSPCSVPNAPVISPWFTLTKPLLLSLFQPTFKSPDFVTTAGLAHISAGRFGDLVI